MADREIVTQPHATRWSSACARLEDSGARRDLAAARGRQARRGGAGRRASRSWRRAVAAGARRRRARARCSRRARRRRDARCACVDDDVLASLSEAETSQGVARPGAAAARSTRTRSSRGTPLIVVGGRASRTPATWAPCCARPRRRARPAPTSPRARADPLSWKALRGSMGSAFRLPHVRGARAPTTRSTRLRRARRAVVAAAAAGGEPLRRGRPHAARWPSCSATRARACRRTSLAPRPTAASPSRWRPPVESLTWRWPRASCSSRPRASGGGDGSRRFRVTLAP